MAENMQQAKAVYATIKKALANIGWTYDEDEEKLMIKTKVTGDDLPVDLALLVRADKDIFHIFSSMPFAIPEDKRVDAAIAACAANYGMVNGSFDLDLNDGQLLFRVTTGYMDTELSERLIEYMILVVVSTVDRYNDRFFMLAKGMIDVAKFLELENG